MYHELIPEFIWPLKFLSLKCNASITRKLLLIKRILNIDLVTMNTPRENMYEYMVRIKVA